jgi:hypothetical protein
LGRLADQAIRSRPKRSARICNLPELRRIVAELVQQRHVCLDLAARRREFARQGVALFLLFRRRPFRNLPELRCVVARRGQLRCDGLDFERTTASSCASAAACARSS